MASRMVLVGCVLLLTALLQGATAVTYTVGDSLGWTTPPGGAIAYSTWANQHTFRVGDNLFFNWTGNHNVAEVSSETDYDNCNQKNVEMTLGSPEVNVPLTTKKDYYYICTVASHCSLGQKVKISVKSASGSPTSSTNSTASSLAVGSFSAVLFSIVIAFLH